MKLRETYIPVEAIGGIAFNIEKTYMYESGAFAEDEYFGSGIGDVYVDHINYVLSMANKGIGPADSHDFRRKYLEEEGWTYGEVYNEEQKTSPALVNYVDLPYERQVLTVLFLRIVRIFIKNMN